jgi:DNA-binding beta-propeller fold protein YncE
MALQWTRPVARVCAALALLLPGLAQALGFELQAASAPDLARPHDIVLSPDGKRLYVADNEAHRVVVLDAVSLARRGELGLGELSMPHDVAFDAGGRLLVADTGNSRIAIYVVSADSGTLAGELRGGASRPEGVAVHPDGRVFATGAASGNLVVYDARGRVIAETGGFSSPHDVAFGPGGEIWVADAGNDRLVQLDDALRTVRVLSGAPYGFKGPRYLDFDGQGRMIVADKYTHRILVIEPGGRLAATLGSGRAGSGPGLFDRPEGVAVRGQDLWLSDTYNDRIVRYRVTP